MYSFNTIEEAAKHYEYTKELLGVGFIGDGWDSILSDLWHDLYIKEKVSKISRPFKISIDRIDNSKPHTKDNCRVVQRHFNGSYAWNEAVFHNIFKHHDAFNETLAIEKLANCHFEEQLRYTLGQLANYANVHYEVFDKYFKYGNLPWITTKYMEKLYKKQNGRCQYSQLLLVQLKDTHFSISIECINTRLPYIHGNICLAINCLNITDMSGGVKVYSEKLGRLLSFNEEEIVNHSPQGWSYNMVNKVREQVSSW